MYRYIVSLIICIICLIIILLLLFNSIKKHKFRQYKYRIAYFLPSFFSILLLINALFLMPLILDIPYLLDAKYNVYKSSTYELIFARRLKFHNLKLKMDYQQKIYTDGKEHSYYYLPWSKIIIYTE